MWKCSLCNHSVPVGELIISPEVYVGLKQLTCDAIVLSQDGSIAPKKEDERIVVSKEDDVNANSSARRVFEVLDIENDDYANGSSDAAKRKRTVVDMSDSATQKAVRFDPHPSTIRPSTAQSTGQSRQDAICLD